MFSCTKCNNSFSSERGLNIHIAKKHSSKDQDVPKKNIPNGTLETSITVNDTGKVVPKKSFHCNACADSFETERGLKIHVGKKHPLEKTDVCKKEQESIVYSRDNDVHKNLFLCTFCSDSFTTERGLKIHVARKHSSNDLDGSQRNLTFKQEPTTQVNDKHIFKETFTCSICSDSFETNRGLKIHVSRKHSSCDPGKFQANSKDKLEPTILVQDPFVKKFQCTICLNSYETERGLKIHVSKTHPGDIDTASGSGGKQRDVCKFPCNICSECFESERNLRIHITTKHSVLDTDIYLPNGTQDPTFQDMRLDKDVFKKQFSCNLCAGSFGTEKGLKVHLTRKHKFRDPDMYPFYSENEEFQINDKEEYVSKQESSWDTTSEKEWSVNDEEDDDSQTVYNNLKIAIKETSQVAREMQKFMSAFMAVLKEKTPNLNWKTFNSGSYYDKTKNTHADEFDIMIYPDNVQVKVDFDDKRVSGFYKVKLMSPRVHPDLQQTLDTYDYIKPAMFKRYVFGLFDEVFKDTKFHEMRRVEKKKKSDDTSPAYTIYYKSIPQRPIDIDLVPCFRMDGWPVIAKNIDPHWITNDKIVNDSIRYYDIVCKTCPEDVPDRDLLWRLSFSYTEKKLITSANDGNQFSTKKKVFRIMKSYIQDIKDKIPDKVKKFCSYHVKQFMLHQFDVWEECEIAQTQKLILNRLIEHLKQTPFIENYFIKSDNVIRYVPKSEIDLILVCLEKESAKL